MQKYIIGLFKIFQSFPEQSRRTAHRKIHCGCAPSASTPSSQGIVYLSET
jgi:hypothetical protein